MKMFFLSLAAFFCLESLSARAGVDFSLLKVEHLGKAKFVVSCAKPSDLPAKAVFGWVALDDGEPFAVGRFDGEGLRARGVVTNDVIAAFGSLLGESRGNILSFRVRASSIDGEGTVASEPFAVAQCEVRERVPRVLRRAGCEPDLTREGARLTIGAEGVTWRFDLAKGELVSLATGSWFSHEWLSAPPRPVLPGACRQLSVKCAEPVVTNGEAVVVSVARWGAGADSVVAYDVVTRWTFRGDGALLCQGEMRPAGRDDRAFVTGWRFDLALSDVPLVECFAKRPLLGRWILEKGIGESSSCRALAYDAGWDHLSLVAGDGPFSLRADAKGFFASSGAPDEVGDRRFAFLLIPEKRFSAPSLPSVELPATVRRIKVGEVGSW